VHLSSSAKDEFVIMLKLINTKDKKKNVENKNFFKRLKTSDYNT